MKKCDKARFFGQNPALPFLGKKGKKWPKMRFFDKNPSHYFFAYNDRSNGPVTFCEHRRSGKSLVLEKNGKKRKVGGQLG